MLLFCKRLPEVTSLLAEQAPEQDKKSSLELCSLLGSVRAAIKVKLVCVKVSTSCIAGEHLVPRTLILLVNSVRHFSWNKICVLVQRVSLALATTR